MAFYLTMKELEGINEALSFRLAGYPDDPKEEKLFEADRSAQSKVQDEIERRLALLLVVIDELPEYESGDDV